MIGLKIRDLQQNEGPFSGHRHKIMEQGNGDLSEVDITI